MNNITSSLLYIFISTLSLIPSIWASWAWSGGNYNETRFRLMIAYTLIVGIPHVGFAQNGTIPFMEPEPDSAFRVASLIVATIHFMCWPVEYERRRWFFGKKPSQTITFKKIHTVRRHTLVDSWFYRLKIATLFLSTTAIYFIVILYTSIFTLEIFTPLTPLLRHLVFFISATVALQLNIWAYRSLHKNGGRL